MNAHEPKDPTALLLAWSRGDQAAFDKLIPLIHDELHRIARRHMRLERLGHTLQPLRWSTRPMYDSST